MTQALKTAALGGFVGAIVALAGALGAVHMGWLSAADGATVHDYIMAHPEILVEAENKLQEQQDASDDAARQTAVDKIGLKRFFDPKVAFVVGPANARTTVVEFFDYNCPYCRASAPTVRRLFEAHGNVRFAFIEFPIKGAQSILAARAALAARNQQPDKYLALHFALMNEQNLVDEKTVYADAQKVGLDVAKLKADMGSPGVDYAIAASHNLAQAVGIDGTPAFIVDGRMREGALDDATLRELTKG
jgi:protein-disulfide isomerase